MKRRSTDENRTAAAPLGTGFKEGKTEIEIYIGRTEELDAMCGTCHECHTASPISIQVILARVIYFFFRV